MDFNQISDQVGRLGFPIVVTGYLLWERAKQTTALTDAVNKLTTVITIIAAKLGVEEPTK